jgi:hypothetical protein
VSARYLDEVDPSQDDAREVSALLFGARERYSSARVIILHILHTVDGELAEVSSRRFVDWRFARGNPGMGIVGKQEPAQPEDFYHDHEGLERAVLLYHDRPDHWLEEWRTLEDGLLRCVVAEGRGEPLWIYEPPETAIHVPASAPLNMGKECEVRGILMGCLDPGLCRARRLVAWKTNIASSSPWGR